MAQTLQIYCNCTMQTLQVNSQFALILTSNDDCYKQHLILPERISAHLCLVFVQGRPTDSREFDSISLTDLWHSL